jgi:hypothetical protein
MHNAASHLTVAKSPSIRVDVTGVVGVERVSRACPKRGNGLERTSTTTPTSTRPT